MPLADDLVALASLAGNTVVAAAATDAWESARGGIARLFGRIGRDRAEMAAQRLEETRGQLAGLAGVDLERAQDVQAQRWATRLTDLLEEDPDAASELSVLVRQVHQAVASYSAAAGRDMAISSSGGIAAGAVRAEAIAGQGGTAIGRMAYHRREVASQPVSLPPRPVFLAGREELLAELHARLTAPASGPLVAVLSGMGGVGKSSLAIEYAHRHLAEVGLAWHFPAEDATVLAGEFSRLAGPLGALDPVAPGDPVAVVHGVLAAFPAGWLLVFDNVTDAVAVRRFLPPGGRGRVLITSQSALWPRGQVLDVPVLDVDVAAAFVVNRTGDADLPAARLLAAELGGLPLALEQAAAYIQATGIALSDYLQLFRARRADLLARGQAAGYDKNVATTWSVAFTQLERSAPEAADLLRLLACLAPEPVPLQMLLAAPRPGDALDAESAAMLERLAGDPLVLGDAVMALRRYSLITPAGDGLLLVHRLVQAVTLAQMPDTEAAGWRQTAAALIEAAIPLNTSMPTTWPTCALLLPHAQVALADQSAGMARIANYLGASGNYATARDLWHKIAEAHDLVSGAEHPDTLAARGNLARWTGQAGDPAAARKMYAMLLPFRERVSGAEHPDTLAARGNLASWTGQAGDPAAARDQFAALLPVRERVSGAEHPDTLTTRANLASWTGHAGDPAAARDQFAALLPFRERVSGVRHPETLATRANLAGWTGQAGEAAAARDQLATLLPDMERILGTAHPDTLNAHTHLASLIAQVSDAS
jgi:tetratricopeptide (TPR) repeat protein